MKRTPTEQREVMLFEEKVPGAGHEKQKELGFISHWRAKAWVSTQQSNKTFYTIPRSGY